MVFAKFIRTSQVAHNNEEFEARKNEKNTVYCKGEISVNKGGLCCVPINLIWQCGKYGESNEDAEGKKDCGFIAIIKCDKEGKYQRGGHSLQTVWTEAQEVIDIIDGYSKETIDFIFNEVEDPSLVDIDSFYLDNHMSEENKKYLLERKQGTL